MSQVVVVHGEGDIAKDVRTGVRDADKDADRATRKVVKEAKHRDENDIMVIATFIKR